MPYETAYDEPLTTSLGDALMGMRAKKRPMPNRAKLGLAAPSAGTPAIPPWWEGVGPESVETSLDPWTPPGPRPPSPPWWSKVGAQAGKAGRGIAGGLGSALRTVAPFLRAAALPAWAGTVAYDMAGGGQGPGPNLRAEFARMRPWVDEELTRQGLNPGGGPLTPAALAPESGGRLSAALMGTPAMPQTMTGDYTPLSPQNAWEGNQLYGTGQPTRLAEALRGGLVTGDYTPAQGMLPIHPGSGGIPARHMGGTPREVAMNPRVSPAASDLRRILSGQQGEGSTPAQASAQDYRLLPGVAERPSTRAMMALEGRGLLDPNRPMPGDADYKFDPQAGQRSVLPNIAYPTGVQSRLGEIPPRPPQWGKDLVPEETLRLTSYPDANKNILREAAGINRRAIEEGTGGAQVIGPNYSFSRPERSTWQMAQETKATDPRLAALYGPQTPTGQQVPTGQTLNLADVIRGRDTARKDTNDMRQLMVTARAQGHPISLQQAMFAHAVNTGKPPQDPGSYAIAGLNPQDSPQLAEQKARYGLFGALMQHPGQMTAQQLADALKGGLGGGGGAVPPVLVPTMVPGQGILGGSGPGQPLNEANLDPLPQTDPAGPQRFVDRTTKLIWRKIVQDGKVTYELESPRVRPGNINIPPLNIGLK